MSNGKDIIKQVKPRSEDPDSDAVARYSKAAYFQEKDRKAEEFLKKHPIPAKFLK